MVFIVTVICATWLRKLAVPLLSAMDSQSPISSPPSNQDQPPNPEMSEENNLDQEKTMVAAVFVSLFKLQGQRYAFFTASLPNDERQEIRSAYHASYAVAVPPDNDPNFYPGLPYKFETAFEAIPGLQIFHITSACDDVRCLAADDGSVNHPVVRGSFIGSEGKFAKFKLSECPELSGASPFIKVFLDQVDTLPSFRFKGDSLLRTRTGVSRENRPFLCVASLVSTIHLGSTSLVPIRDSPSLEFVYDLCLKFEVQVLFGGRLWPQPSLPYY